MYGLRVPLADGVRVGEHRDGRHRRHREEEVDGNFQSHSGIERSPNCKKRRNNRPRGIGGNVKLKYPGKGCKKY